jgi:hypothetical protein
MPGRSGQDRVRTQSVGSDTRPESSAPAAHLKRWDA